MAGINKLFLQKVAFGGIIVGSKIELLRWQRLLSGVFCKNGVLKNFAKFTRKRLSWSFFEKVAGLKPSTFLKRNSNTSVLLWILQNFKITYSVESMQAATSGLINSCQTSKWLIYTYYHISVKCRGNPLPCYLFYAYALLILNSIYKDTFWLNQ